MKKGVIYARYSCDKQTDNSTKAQVRECSDWAKRNGITIVDSYIDEAISGRTDNRPAFQKMIRDAKLHLFDCVIVYKGDRFSRSRADAAKYKNILNKLGIPLLSATEANLEGPEKVLMDGINEAMAEYYSVELAQKITRGMTQNVIEGRFNGGKLPLGYKINKVTRAIEVDEEEAEIVRDIFDKYLYKGYTPFGIRTFYMNLGRKLARDAIIRILHNERYTGVWRSNLGVNETLFPPIISKELFQEAQAKLAINSKRGSHFKPRERYYLVGKLICGVCNSYFVSTSGTARSGEQFRYYSCPECKGAKKEKHMPNLVKNEIEKVVLEAVLDMIKSSKTVNHIIDRILSTQSTENPEAQTIAKAIAKADKTIENLTTAIAMGGNMAVLVKKLNETTELKEKLEYDLKATQSSNSMLTREQLEGFFDAMKTIDISTPENKAFLIDVFVNSVYVYDDDSVVITTNFRGEDGLFLKRAMVRLPKHSVHHS